MGGEFIACFGKNMTTITCPDTLYKLPVVFVAGGISGCVDWQSEMIHLLDNDNIVLLNPRRDSFEVNDLNFSKFQIMWEYTHLKRADLVLFWFPAETLCPITLFELGVISLRGTDMVVGCHPQYTRRFDVITQLSLYRPDVKVQDSITEVANMVNQWCNNRT